MTYTFTLTSDGRPLAITMAGETKRTLRTSDLPPAIAGSRFSERSAATECTVTFTEEMTPLAEAPLEDLVLMRSYSTRSRIPRETWKRFVSGDCDAKPRPRPLLRAYPDFRKLPGPPGARDWVFLSFDTDAEGKPVNVAVVESTGNEALNAESVAAIEASQDTEGERTGCLRYYWTGHGTVKAPDRPDIDTYGAQPEACRADDRWATKPKLKYPRAYQRRGIEGWVTMRFDVAPWGEIGNIEVIDAQPTQDLSRYAIPILRSAKYSELETGLKGCIERVVFRLPDRSKKAPEPEGEAGTETEEVATAS